MDDSADKGSADRTSQQFWLQIPRVLTQINQQIAQSFGESVSKTGIPHDTMQVGDVHNSDLGQCGELHTGRVQFVMPFAGWYRVAVDNVNGVVPCCSLETQTSSELIGPRAAGMYQPCTEVLLMLFRKPEYLYGIILGAIPQIMIDGNVCFSDWITQGSGAGALREGYYTHYITGLKDEGGVIDFSNNRPVDQTVFDWGIHTETGGRIHIDPFMIQLQFDELCGIMLHYVDQHMSVAGYGLDVLSAVHNEEYTDDEGELSYYRGEAIYVHEASGAFEAGEDAMTSNSDTDVQFDKHVGKLEPRAEGQVPFMRYEEWGGYLGQGRIRSLSTPPQYPPVVWTLDASGDATAGLFREQISLDGEYFLCSAKGVTFAKRALIPVPKRKRLAADYQEDSDGAFNANYKAAGLYGDSGEEHKPGKIEDQGENTDRLSAAAILDQQAYLVGWKSVHPFCYHTGDFELPEEEDMLGEVVQEALNFGDLEDSDYFEKSLPFELKIDHRQEAAFYALLSMLSLQDDGTVVLQGGHGEEIIFDHGTIRVNAPGSIMLSSGRSTVVMSGDDAIVRANSSVDITANKYDVRIKAERNLHTLSGNSGTGGTLLENRAFGNTQNYPTAGGEAIESSGVVVKAANSVFATMAGNVYLSAGVATSPGSRNSGNIVLDAGDGSGDVHLYAQSFNKFLLDVNADLFMVSGQIDKVIEHNRGSIFADGQLGITGPLRVGSHAQFGGQVAVIDGHFSSTQGGPAGRLRDPSIVRGNLIAVGTELERVQEYADDEFQREVQNEYLDRDKLGYPTTQVQISFGMRSTTENNTSNFVLPASHWQNMANATGGTGNAWNENVIKYQGSQDHMPWPGKAKWQDEETLLTLPADSFNQYDLTKGLNKSRDDASFDEPKRGPFVNRKPQGNYRVIVQ